MILLNKNLLSWNVRWLSWMTRPGLWRRIIRVVSTTTCFLMTPTTPAWIINIFDGVYPLILLRFRLQVSYPRSWLLFCAACKQTHFYRDYKVHIVLSVGFVQWTSDQGRRTEGRVVVSKQGGSIAAYINWALYWRGSKVEAAEAYMLVPGGLFSSSHWPLARVQGDHIT